MKLTLLFCLVVSALVSGLILMGVSALLLSF